MSQNVSSPPDALHTSHRHVLDLSEQDAAAAHALAAECAREYKSPDDQSFLDEAPVIAHDLPLSVRRHVNAAHHDERAHATVIRGNVVRDEELGETPGHWSVSNTKSSEAYACLLVLYSALLGDVIGWQAQQSGRLVTDILPSRGYEHSLVSASSELELAWHTEDAFSPHRADWVGLFALRNSGVPTTLSHIDLSRLPERFAKILSEPRFTAVPDASHEYDEDAPQAEPVAVLSGHPACPVLRIDRDYFQAQEGDAEAAEAFAWVVEHLDGNLSDIPILAGDVCFVDNRNVVHGRRAFRAGFDGRDRWLKRVNVVRDLRRTRPGRIDGTTRVIV
ncbi:TauD/TfdA family dioxygenase [Streptomyces somaliensis DSM 40738]|uniref:TauD/TfdA-like domain-containing protein n=1 Tax=Streptomyces somaliensis (strain ATCC 33201 / DSM 40738 / JCM 12659 / KCTC 9044 / NCTC 11332 / NRRL B-12077 / IP 733) TaxID=1134445 RepID=A0AA44DAG6_STRE0|nr:guanitoxin biosynthesis L-enduracididine beta-hydroxylase GntD [Streptomyces somaliensis]MCQ0024262.1 TauD/TfdA family dioxygenase [Streptomyces somaliensis DSM 40738]NKY12873.1 hypothetical protein [Streptomyces somaliensis DSM 40738]